MESSGMVCSSLTRHADSLPGMTAFRTPNSRRCRLTSLATTLVADANSQLLRDSEDCWLGSERATRFPNVTTRAHNSFSSVQYYYLCKLTFQHILNIPLLLLAMYSRIQLGRQPLCHGLTARMEPTQNFEN